MPEAKEVNTPVSEMEQQENLEEPSALSLTDKRNIGKWGEEYVLECLVKAREGKCDEKLGNSREGFKYLRNGKIVAELHWLNSQGDVRNHYDIKVIEAGSEEYIEVKSTKMEDKDWVDISRAQWEFAKQKGDRFSIYRVYGAGTKNPKLVVIKNPHMQWQSGELIAYPIRICM